MNIIELAKECGAIVEYSGTKLKPLEFVSFITPQLEAFATAIIENYKPAQEPQYLYVFSHFV
jgi:hypothetical protein